MGGLGARCATISVWPLWAARVRAVWLVLVRVRVRVDPISAQQRANDLGLATTCPAGTAAAGMVARGKTGGQDKKMCS